jgi:hypothetical protein
MVPKLEGSAVAISIAPGDGEGDVKFWVELGAMIMMDKPIVVVARPGQVLPQKLLAVADDVVYGDPRDSHVQKRLINKVDGFRP